MNAVKHCPECHAPVPPDAPGGHCPQCLLALAGAGEVRLDSGRGFGNKDRRFGDYVLGRQLGAGGMGVVYEARQLRDGRVVALKLIRDVYVASPADLCRFTIEAEAVARLHHPHIVRIHDVGECQGHPYFSMDFIPGESLQNQIVHGAFARKPGPARAAASRSRQEAIARLMIKIARAVDHAHQQGVLHRDLKPANILMDADGEPRLTDFGLAKLVYPPLDPADARFLTDTGVLLGTPNYMAPEQVAGLPVTRAADLYGLGAILYQLLTGAPPYEGPTPLETLKHIAERDPPRPRAADPAIHPDLETICLKCLEKDPRRRYASAAALAADLEHWLAGRPINARRAGPVRRLRQWVQRNPIGTALMASLCLGLAVALGLLKVVNDQRREIERDRDQTFDEGMNKISLIWKDPEVRSVTISARELAILAGQSPGHASHAQHQLYFGISTEGDPSSMAQRYARWLTLLQHAVEEELGDTVTFRLKLFKRFNQDEDSLARGDADLMMLSAVDFLKAQAVTPGVTAIARAAEALEAVLFAHTNSGVRHLTELRGKAVAFADPDLALSVWAKARLADAGLRAADLRQWTNVVDQGLDSGASVLSLAETINLVLAGDWDAGITYRERFERYQHRGLTLLDHFPGTPDVLAARQGLAPPLVQALRRAARTLTEPSELPLESSPLTVPLTLAAAQDFDALQSAIRKAEDFESLNRAMDNPRPK